MLTGLTREASLSLGATAIAGLVQRLLAAKRDLLLAICPCRRRASPRLL